MIRPTTPLAVLALAALAIGCVGTTPGGRPAPGDETAVPEASAPGERGGDRSAPELSEPVLEFSSALNLEPVQLAIEDLAKRSAVAPRNIEPQDVMPMEWPDASLGCPAPRVDYAQVVTPGYRIGLTASGEIYWYHTDEGELVVLCEDGEPVPPAIPIQPGERIQDGKPWMPVDPIPPPSS